MLVFCPRCHNILGVKGESGGNSFKCATCPYIHPIQQPVMCTIMAIPAVYWIGIHILGIERGCHCEAVDLRAHASAGRVAAVFDVAEGGGRRAGRVRQLEARR